MFAGECASLCLVVLVVTIDGFVHPLLQQSFLIVSEERITESAPYDYDDIPTRTAKCAFELLNDLAVSANRSVETLQVAVDNENEIVEPLARRQTQYA